MAVEAHLTELINKHQLLDNAIESELKTPSPNTLHLSTLKKRKLHLKEQITALQN